MELKINTQSGTPISNNTGNDISKLKWTVNWIEPGTHSHYKLGDKMELTITNSQVSKFRVDEGNGWSPRDLVSERPSAVLQLGSFCLVEFYFFDASKTHSHRAHFCFSLVKPSASHEALFVYDIQHVQQGKSITSAHGKGGGTGN